MTDLTSIAACVKSYEVVRDQLEEISLRLFPVGQKVMLDCETYRGEAVVRNRTDKPNTLEVLVEGHIIWLVHITACRPINP